MNKKRDLLRELKLKGPKALPGSPHKLDVQNIKGLVHQKIDSAPSERKSDMKTSKKKIALVALAATLVLGVTVFAGGSLVTNWYSSSSSLSDYTSLPTKEQVVKDIGYAPVLIEAFENGYAFEEGSVINNNLTDENENSVEAFKSISFSYEKGGDVVNFSQEQYYSDMGAIGAIAETVDGIEVYYHSYTNKLVPPDYQMTEADKKAEESGDLVFSWGSPEVEITEIQQVFWEENGLRCSLMQTDGALTPEALVEMAKEAILQ